MTLPQLYERVASLPSGGALTVDTRLNKGFVYSLIHAARAFIVEARWGLYGKIPPIYYQKHKPTYSVLSQDADSCYVKFYDIPDVIALGSRSSGLGFIGGDGGTCQFREVSSRSAFMSMMNNRIIKAKRKPLVLLLGEKEMEIYVNNNQIENIQMEAIFADPTKVSSFNVNYDDYPMDISDIPKIENYILQQGASSLIYKTPMDRVNDQRDTTVPPPVRL